MVYFSKKNQAQKRATKPMILGFCAT